MGTLLNNRLTRPIFNPAMRALVRFGPSRRWLNAIHNRMDYSQNESFFWSFASAFRGVPANKGCHHDWTAHFGAADIAIPLNGGEPWECWGTAVGLRGHDSIVKATYDAILSSPRRPDLFVDVGANNGTHSLLMATNNVAAFAFEPNPVCRGIAKRLYEHNRVSVDWRQVAVGDCRGLVRLSYPSGDTSLGMVGDATALRNLPGYETVEVSQETLDNQTFPKGRMLIKIDVEGRELAVLRRGLKLIADRSPIIVFESNVGDRARPDLHALFDQLGYRIEGLPWRFAKAPDPLDSEDFAASQQTNFIALPAQEASV